MALASGIHRLGPDNASLQVKTYREGMAAKVGHDLVIDVTRWDATVDLTASTVELNADPRSLEVREACAVSSRSPTRIAARSTRTSTTRSCTGSDRVPLHGRPAVRGGRALVVEGQLTMAGTTRPVTAQLDVERGWPCRRHDPLDPERWGIKPYRGLMAR